MYPYNMYCVLSLKSKAPLPNVYTHTNTTHSFCVDSFIGCTPQSLPPDSQLAACEGVNSLDNTSRIAQR